MADPATWYLVLKLASSLLSPDPQRSPLVGPVTEEQCQQSKAALGGLPSVISAQCQRAVAMMTCDIYGRPGAYTVCPVFDDGRFVPTASYK